MSGEGWLSMRYRDFYDVPRLVAVEYGGRVYPLDSPFEEGTDEYADHYTVYQLPDSAGRPARRCVLGRSCICW